MKCRSVILMHPVSFSGARKRVSRPLLSERLPAPEPSVQLRKKRQSRTSHLDEITAESNVPASHSLFYGCYSSAA